jgi:hypothetical protein
MSHFQGNTEGSDWSVKYGEIGGKMSEHDTERFCFGSHTIFLLVLHPETSMNLKFIDLFKSDLGLLQIYYCRKQLKSDLALF